MKKYKNTISAVLLLATLVLAPISVGAAETALSPTEANTTNFIFNLTDEKNISLAPGSHTNLSQIKLDWNDIAGAQSYELYAWSDTKAPSVRLLTTEQISSDAVVTKLTSSVYDIDFIRDGNYFYAVKALDSSGVILESSGVVGLTYDKTAPKVAVINPKHDQEIIGNSLIANGSVTDINLDYYYFILRDSSGQTILTSSQIKEAVSNGVIANLDISTYLSGNYDIAFVARDKAGNQTMLTDPDETASFIVLRKGDGNTLSNPPRPTEPTPAVIVPALSSINTTESAAPRFKLVSAQNVLGVTSKSANSLASLSQEGADKSDAKIFAVAKSPAKQSHNVLYLALIPIVFCIGLVIYEKRQTVSVKQ